MLDVEGARRISTEDRDGGFRPVQRPKKLTLTISAVPPLLANAESTSFEVNINSVKALGFTAGQDTWQKLLTVPTVRARTSLGVPLPNAPLSQRAHLE